MTRFHFLIATSCLTMILATQTAHARGFGGMHAHVGGGMHMSAPHMSAPHMSAPHMSAPRMGGGNFGGARPNMGSFGGARPGGFSPAGGFAGRGTSGLGSANRFGGGSLGPGALSGGGLSKLGFPGGSAGGFGKAGRGAGGLAAKNPLAGAGGLGDRGALGGAKDAPGRTKGTLGSASSALGAAKLGARTSQSQLSSFLGLPSDHGMHSVTSHAINHRALTSPAVNNRALTSHAVNRRHTAADLARHGDYVRSNFRGRGFYNRDWYRRYPGCWYPRRWAYGTVWAAWDWAYLNGWFGWGGDPIYYDYGNTVVYQDNSVYVNGDNVGTSDEYYQQASDLADAGAATGTDADTSATGDDGEWLPLGVFAMSHDDQTKANLILQLAVNKQGIIRGNYTATLTNDTKPLQGSVDKKTQRAAWTIGDNKTNVIETGIDNLTKDEAPCLVHMGKDKTEQWVLVRLKNDDDSTASSGDQDSSATTAGDDKGGDAQQKK